MRFDVVSSAGGDSLDFEPSRVFLAGYTGRDQAAVEAHVRELAEHGIPAPARVPSVFPLVPARLTTDTRICVYGARTAGEAEFVLFLHGDQVYVGVGSDHTDRELEEHSIVRSKQCVDKPMSAQVWQLEEVADHWDELRLRSAVLEDSAASPYQDGTVASMMTPDALLAEIEGRAGRKDGDVVWSGTLPIIGGQFRAGWGFQVELIDPVLDRSLRCEYRVEELPVLDE